MTAYDDSNIFARILRGEIPCHEVWQDEVALAFMDIHPMTPGHTLVLPKAPARNLFDAKPSDLSALITRVQKIALAAKTALDCDGVTIHQFNEAAAGQSVFHLHFHILPRWEGQALKPHVTEPADAATLRELAAKIRRAIV